MKCNKCGMENEAGAKFCGSCGSVLAAPRPATQPTAGSNIKCPTCGRINPGDSAFCESCGAKLTVQPAIASASIPTPTPRPSIATYQTQQPAGHVSGAWWLLPIFLLWVGGLIAFLVNKDINKSLSTKMLWTGIILTIIWIAVYVIMMVVSFMLSGLEF